MRPCGCILSARALREVEASAKAEARRTANNNNDDNNTSSDTNGTAAATGLSCAQCGTALASTDDIVPLNRPKEEYEEAQRVILQRQETLRLEKAARKAAAKAAKRAAKLEAAAADGDSGASTSSNKANKRDAAALDGAKKSKKAKTAPDGAPPTTTAAFSTESDVYKSLFKDKNGDSRETFACRSVSGRYF